MQRRYIRRSTRVRDTIATLLGELREMAASPGPPLLQAGEQIWAVWQRMTGVGRNTSLPRTSANTPRCSLGPCRYTFQMSPAVEGGGMPVAADGGYRGGSSYPAPSR